jgi:putative thioredoxin
MPAQPAQPAHQPAHQSASPGAGKFADSPAIDLAAKPPPQDTPAPVVSVTDEGFGALVEQSKQVPVILDLWATWCEPCKQLSPVLEQLAREFGGRFLLAKIDIEAAPQVAQAFSVQSVPFVAALIGGQAVPLFAGAQPAERIRPVIEEVLRVAASQGVTGVVQVRADDGAPPPPPPLPPLHAQALEAIDAGDLEGAAQTYRQALTENPGDAEAKAALGQVELLLRSGDQDSAAVLAAAAADPTDIDKALAAADAEIAAGASAAAFERLLGLIRTTRGDDRDRLRVRLVEYFDIAGPGDPAVGPARRALATALF